MCQLIKYFVLDTTKLEKKDQQLQVKMMNDRKKSAILNNF